MVTAPDFDLVILKIHTVKRYQSYIEDEGALAVSCKPIGTAIASVVFPLGMGNTSSRSY